MKMKRRFMFIPLLVLTIIASAVLFACNDNDAPKTWTVTFDYNYTGAPSATPVDVNDGEKVAEPTPEPTRAEYDFTGWFTDPACAAASAFAFTTDIGADTRLYAGWELKEIPPPPKTGVTDLYFASKVGALEGTWTVSKVYANGAMSNAVADAITLNIVSTLDPYELVDGVAYLHNQVYNFTGSMTFGIPAVNAELDADGIERYTGTATWEDFSMGKVVAEGGFYEQPGPAAMYFNGDVADYGLFLDLVAGISDINTKNRSLILGMNYSGQLLLGYSSANLLDPDATGDWNYCLIFDKKA